MIDFCLDSIRNYFDLYKTNIIHLKSEGFTHKFSLTLTISTGIAATVTGILCSLLVIDGRVRILSYFILISLINFPLLVIVVFYKISSYRQMRKYRNGKINLIKP
jgi:hypothetical protein